MEAHLKNTFFAVAAAALALAGCGQSATGGDAGEGGGRQEIRIVGSSTVYPFTQAVAERFAQANASGRAPVVESTGTGGGIELFCAGVGADHPDIANASRRIKDTEIATCAENGVTRIIEIPVGIDGLALIESVERPTNFQLTSRDIYAALAANPFGRPQTARTWRDVNPELPDVAIMVYGPPPTSGTRDSFAELILDEGCDSDPAMVALKEEDSDRHEEVCRTIREDGAFVEAGENDNLLMQRVAANQGAIGVLGYSFLAENAELVKGISIDGVAPSVGTIQDFSYPGARQLYIYVKGEHLDVIPGLREFLAEYARAWSEGGYLAERGLIPSPADVQQRAAEAIRNPTPITAADLQ
ncbi:MAG: substrate-binding domain-containing protein [Sphingomonadaceae bacterium]|nr:substrate-binding domain-containing protein [Sphingomonadaceae bacterium]